MLKISTQAVDPPEVHMKRAFHIPLIIIICTVVIPLSCAPEIPDVEVAKTGNGSGANSATQPSISVIQPNDGEEITGGTTYRIVWSTRDVTGNVDIEYSIDGEWDSVVDGTENDGSYDWSVPDADSHNALVRIKSSDDGSIIDESDSSFSIVSATPEDSEKPVNDDVDDDYQEVISEREEQEESIPRNVIEGTSEQDTIPVITGSGRETEPNDNNRDACPLSINTVGTGILTSDSDDNDYWKFSLQDSYKVVVYWTITGGDDYGVVRLENEDGDRIDSDQFADEMVYEVYAFLHPGVYYINVAQSYHTSQYTIIADTTPMDLSEVEPNDTVRDMGWISLNTNYTGIMSEHSDTIDLYAFTLDRDTGVEILWEIYDGEPYGSLKLLNEEESRIEGDSFDDEGLYEIEAFLTAGTYIVELTQGYHSVYYGLSVNTQ